MIHPLYGGVKWREGADTCIFKPMVTCGPHDPAPGFVSRILNAADAATDVQVEEIIRNIFPDLVARRLVAVHTYACTPHYEDRDRAVDPSFQPAAGKGCAKLGALTDANAPNHVNLITPEMDGTLDSYLRSPDTGRYAAHWRNLLQGAIQAAVTMVPDDGPWIVHGDCHFNNVLCWNHPERGLPITALADWGRTLVIENPADLDSVKSGIRNWVVVASRWLPAVPPPSDAAIAATIRTYIGRTYRQLPDPVLNALAGLMEMRDMSNADAFAYRIAHIRGWVPYALIKEILLFVPSDALYDPVFNPAGSRAILDAILLRPSQYYLSEYLTSIFNTTRHKAMGRDVIIPLPAGGGRYWPEKYHRGLSAEQNAQRKRSATRRAKMSWKNPKAYVPWKSDKGAKTRRSSYTSKFHAKYPDAKTLPEIAKATGISKSVLQEVYDRGMAAWRTGHRPGASQHAWGMARVHSFVMKGKTWRTADKDLAGKV